CSLLSRLLSCACCADHIDLPSFPTRRSSDLEDVRAELRKKIESVAAERGLEATLSSLALPVPTFEVGSDAALVRAAESVTGALADRKSTRLNSSHVKISYAVSCLKKRNLVHS